MSDDDSKITDKDNDLFRQAMNGVNPIRNDRILHRPKPPRPLPRQRQLDDAQVLVDMMSDDYDVAEVETGEELLFIRPSLPPRTVKKLRRGEFSIEAELDLHGMFRDDARTALATFLTDSRQRGLRCVRVIHGKGHGSRDKKPVLKNLVNRWLQQRDEVLAFCSARPVDGGTGAVYVLLRKPA
jgi:DNA-nicking Smr family endonuclease